MSQEIDWADVPVDTRMTVWVSPAVDALSGTVAQIGMVWSGLFKGIDHPTPEAVPWCTIEAQQGVYAAFPLSDIAQVSID